jgi:hypothetical protein
MKKPARKAEGSNISKKKSFAVRLTLADAAEVEKIAEAHLWSFSKTLGVLIEKALQAKVLR